MITTPAGVVIVSRERWDSQLRALSALRPGVVRLHLFGLVAAGVCLVSVLVIARLAQPKARVLCTGRATLLALVVMFGPTMVGVMQARVISVIHHFQVLGAIIVLDTVAVVNYFRCRKRTTKHRLHHHAVLPKIAALAVWDDLRQKRQVTLY